MRFNAAFQTLEDECAESAALFCRLLRLHDRLVVLVERLLRERKALCQRLCVHQVEERRNRNTSTVYALEGHAACEEGVAFGNGPAGAGGRISLAAAGAETASGLEHPPPLPHFCFGDDSTLNMLDRASSL